MIGYNTKQMCDMLKSWRVAGLVCCLWVVKLFQIATATVFLWFSQNLAHVLCANMHKTVEHFFEILLLQFLQNFLILFK